MMSPGAAPPSAGTGQGHAPAEIVSDLPGVLLECSGPGSLQTEIRPAPGAVTGEGHFVRA